MNIGIGAYIVWVILTFTSPLQQYVLIFCNTLQIFIVSHDHQTDKNVTKSAARLASS